MKAKKEDTPCVCIYRSSWAGKKIDLLGLTPIKDFQIGKQYFPRSWHLESIMVYNKVFNFRK